MKNLIPHFIQDQFALNRIEGKIEGYVLFVDLTGFTAMTEELLKKDIEGAEALSLILNNIFTPLVRFVYQNNGFIPHFAGDAFTAIFPHTSSTEVVDIINMSQQFLRIFRTADFSYEPTKKYNLEIKIGLTKGVVEWGILGKQNKMFYFKGAAIDKSTNAALASNGKEIVFDDPIKSEIENLFHLDKVDDTYYSLAENLATEKVDATFNNLPELNADIAYHFLPDDVIQYDQPGEFRNVVTIFINFQGLKGYRDLNRFIAMALHQITAYSGYFKEIDYGDKGAMIVAFFGAPRTFENVEERALTFILDLFDEVNNNDIDNKVDFRAGLSYGLAYTGIVGGIERCQYTAVGNRVNLAVRLMAKANWGQILVDNTLSKVDNFIFEHRGFTYVKGVENKVNSFSLIGKKDNRLIGFEGEMVGRNHELNQLFQFSKDIISTKKAGIAYVFGEAGIGKSRLVFELKLKINQLDSTWATCQTDQILQKPLNPFLYFLRNYFNQSVENSIPANKDNFENKYNEIIAKTKPESSQLKELIRTKSVLGARLGIFYPDSLWDKLDGKGRLNNTFTALINLFQLESLERPFFLELEDAHWVDKLSIEFVGELTRAMANYPFGLFITSRYSDDGTKVKILKKKVLKEINISPLTIDLNILSKESIQAYTRLKLNGPISEELEKLLMRTTNGNPFYLEQVIEYFQESDLLYFTNGKWLIKDKNIKLSNSIQAILMARIDRLSNLVKETVKAAAVIGREFEVPVLSEVMKIQHVFQGNLEDQDTLVREQIKQAEKGQIWRAMNELRYIFKHSLLREAVYEMQLRGRLKLLHKLIAEAIEKIYPNSISERYVDLAYHFEKAEDTDKTIEYLKKSGDFARHNFQNRLALSNYSKLIKYLEKEGSSRELIKVKINKGQVQELIGKWDKAEKLYKEAIEEARKLDIPIFLGITNNSLGKLLVLKGQYEEAKLYLNIAVRLFENENDKLGISKVYGNLGNLFFRQGDYDQAKNFFSKSISLANEHSQTSYNAQIVSNLGLAYMNQGDYQMGIESLSKQLIICDKLNDKQGSATLHTNLGIVLFEKGDYSQALKHYEEGLKLSKELGNKLLTSIAVGCIGTVYEKKGDYSKAMELYEEDLRLTEELGDKQGISIALGLIGNLLSTVGDFDKGIFYSEKNLKISETLGYQKGIAKALNTLADIYNFKKEYETSNQYYDQSILLSEKMDNKLIMGLSLVEKGINLIALDNLEEAQNSYQKALPIANALDNTDLKFEAELLSIKILTAQKSFQNAEEKINILLPQATEKNKLAAVLFEKLKLHPKDHSLYDEVQELYSGLFGATPKISYKEKLDHLNKIKK